MLMGPPLDEPRVESPLCDDDAVARQTAFISTRVSALQLTMLSCLGWLGVLPARLGDFCVLGLAPVVLRLEADMAQPLPIVCWCSEFRRFGCTRCRSRSVSSWPAQHGCGVRTRLVSIIVYHPYSAAATGGVFVTCRLSSSPVQPEKMVLPISCVCTTKQQAHLHIRELYG